MSGRAKGAAGAEGLRGSADEGQAPRAEQPRWWEGLQDDDPITLEPLATLPGPPFELFPKTSSNGGREVSGVRQRRFLFDAPVLAEYIISQGRFENPYNRESLTREDCLRLDDHCRRLKIKGHRDVSVTAAWDLQQSIKLDKSPGGNEVAEQRALALRREASTALLHLFQYRRIGRRQKDEENRRRRNRGRVQHDEDGAAGFSINPHGLQIIDDDEEACRSSHDSTDKQNKGSNEDFPQLLSSADALEDLRQAANLPAPDFLRLAESLAATYEQKQRAIQSAHMQRQQEKEQLRLAQEEARVRYRKQCEDAIRQLEADQMQQDARMEHEQRLKNLRLDAEWETARAVQEVEQAVAAAEEKQREQAEAEERIAARRRKEKEDAEKAKAEEEAALLAAEQKKEREKERKKRQKERQKEKKKVETAEAEKARAEEERRAAERLAKEQASLRCSFCSEGEDHQAFRGAR